MRDEGWGKFTNLSPTLGIMDLKEFGQVFELFSHLQNLGVANVCLVTAYTKSSIKFFHLQSHLYHTDCMSKKNLAARREAILLSSHYQYLLKYQSVCVPQSPCSSLSWLSIILVSIFFTKICRCLQIWWCIPHFPVNSLHSLEIKQLTANWRKTDKGIGPMCAFFYH